MSDRGVLGSGDSSQTNEGQVDEVQAAEAGQAHEVEENGGQDEAVPAYAASEPVVKPAPSSSKLWMGVSAVLFVALVASLIYSPFGGGAKQAAAEDPETVAIVNGTNIQKSALYDEMITAGAGSLLNQLIEKELIRQKLDEAGITVADADVDKEVSFINKMYFKVSDEEFEAQLMQNFGMTVEALRKELVTQVQIRKLLEPQVTITDEQVSEYYEANKDSLATSPEEVRASHILLPTQEEADAVLAELQQGADFAELATAKSTDPGSKDKGGDLDFFGRNVMHAEFEEAAFALQVGEMTSVVQSPSGFHIIKLTDRHEAVVPTLEESKDDIRYILTSEQIQGLSEAYFADLYESAEIRNLLEERAATETAGDAAGAGNASTNANAQG